MGYVDEYKKWSYSPSLTDEDRNELIAIKDDSEEIKDRFFAPLSFGTAGLRGVMGIGLRRMNVYVVRHATQGFASVIREQGEAAMARGVVICYDCRNNALAFAREAACVMAANGIKVRLFDALRPTPELSFAIRKYGAIAGINITASHNTKEYNGYKVYWEDGAQLPPEHAEAVAAAMSETDIFDGILRYDFDMAASCDLIEMIGAETDEAFLAEVLAQAIDREAVSRASESLRIVYTPFYGAGRILVPEALRRLGIRQLYPVDEQMRPDGNFPSVKSPNPEYAEGFELAIALAREKGAPLIIGTDPDSDRVGVMVARDGGYVQISGNQMGVLLMDYIIASRRAAGTLPGNAAVLKSIVTTEMAACVAAANGVYIEDTFTGFKFMAEKMLEFENSGAHQVIFSYEESYGYLIGDFVRDKDAVTASVLIAEMAAAYHLRGMTLYDAIQALYEKYGYFAEKTLNLVMPGLDGLEKMAALMHSLREAPPAEIGDIPVSRVRDYLDGTVRAADGSEEHITLRGSDVLYYELSDGTRFIVRPSGTEPKIKVYIMAQGPNAEQCSRKVAACEQFAHSLER